MNFIFLFFVGGLALLGWAALVEPRWFELSRHSVNLRKKIPRPLRILHLSDTHFARPYAPLSCFFDRLSQEEFDLVFITGDLMDCQEGIADCLVNLKKLKTVYGIYAVFGNHDYYDYRGLDSITHNFPGQGLPKHTNDVDAFQKDLEAKGVTVLRNHTVEILIDNMPVLIHGLDDPTTGKANLRTAMDRFDPTKLNILLTHTVDVFLDIGENEIDLAFSGHSHGGQIRLPIIGPMITHTRIGRQYASGIHQLQGATCCISRGMNSGRYTRIRLLCRPEALLITAQGS